ELRYLLKINLSNRKQVVDLHSSKLNPLGYKLYRKFCLAIFLVQILLNHLLTASTSIPNVPYVQHIECNSVMYPCCVLSFRIHIGYNATVLIKLYVIEERCIKSPVIIIVTYIIASNC